MDNRRKTIVINKKFQYQYSLLIAALAVLLVNGFLLISLLFPGEQSLTLSTSMALGLALVEFILIASIWFGSLRASHRIAGPVYVFAREIGKLGSGDLTANISLRDKDMFQSEAAGINTSIEGLRAKISAIQGLSDQLNKIQAAGGDTGTLVRQLSDELSTFITATER